MICFHSYAKTHGEIICHLSPVWYLNNNNNNKFCYHLFEIFYLSCILKEMNKTTIDKNFMANIVDLSSKLEVCLKEIYKNKIIRRNYRKLWFVMVYVNICFPVIFQSNFIIAFYCFWLGNTDTNDLNENLTNLEQIETSIVAMEAKMIIIQQDDRIQILIKADINDFVVVHPS